MTQAASLPRVLVTEGSHPRPLAWLKERADVVEVGPTDDGFLDAVASAEGMVVRTYTRVTDELLAKAPRLKVVGRGGVGLDNIDLDACQRRGITVVSTPSANTDAVVDLVVAQMIRLVRPTCEFHDHAYAPAEFKQVRNTNLGRQLNELTLGILGMGRVGRRLGRIARAFGMRVIYNDLVDVFAQIDYDATAVDKPTLFADADVLTIHVDLRPGNENLIAAPEIAQMKDGAVLINMSRGEVADAGAIAEAIQSGKLSGCALDVYAPEPPAADFPLLGLPNVLLTPHMGSRTHTAVENMSWVVRDVLRVLAGETPEWPAF